MNQTLHRNTQWADEIKTETGAAQTVAKQIFNLTRSVKQQH